MGKDTKAKKAKGIKPNEYLEKVATFENNQFDYPHKEIEKEFFDPVETEKLARKSLIETIKKELDFSDKIYELDYSIRSNLPSMEAYKQEIIEMLNNYGKNLKCQ